MIKSFKSKRLKAFYDGDESKVDSRSVANIRVVLTALDSAFEVEDFRLPGKRLHMLKQFDPVRWSLDVSPNWRITFEWDGKNVLNVDYEDPH